MGVWTSAVGHIRRIPVNIVPLFVLQGRIRVDAQRPLLSVLDSHQEQPLPLCVIQFLLDSHARLDVLELYQGVNVLLFVNDNLGY